MYTNAPKRRREAILANLCTLLRRRPGGDAHAALAVTQLLTHTNSRSLVKVLRFAGRLGAMAATLPFGVTCLFDGPLSCAVHALSHGRATRRHRVARGPHTRRHRVAQKSAYAQLPGNVVPLDATEWHGHRALGVTEWHSQASKTSRQSCRTQRLACRGALQPAEKRVLRDAQTLAQEVVRHIPWVHATADAGGAWHAEPLGYSRRAKDVKVIGHDAHA